MLGRFILTLGACLIVLTVSVVAQSPEDRMWREFLAWLRTAPAANGPLEMIQGYQQNLAGKGIAPPEVGRQMGIVLRLTRERDDAWPLMFDKISGGPAESVRRLPDPSFRRYRRCE